MKKTYYLLIFLLTGLAACFVAACSDDEVTGGSATVETVGNPVTEITIANATGGVFTLSDIDATVTAQVSAMPSNADDAGNYVFTSGDTKVFTVNQGGLITATGYGEATLSVVAQNNAAVSATCKVLVVGTPVTTVTFDSETYTVTRTNAAGPVFEMASHVTVTPANASVKTLKYTSSHPEVAIVSEDGDVWPLWEGATVIKAEALDGSGVFGACTYTVNIMPVTSIIFNSPATNTTYYQFSLNDRDNRDYNHSGPSDEAQLTNLDSPLTMGTATASHVRYQPANATKNTLEYESLNPNVLTVKSNSDNRCVITPVSAGTATIRAKATDGHDAYADQVFKIHHMLDQSNWTVVKASSSAYGTKQGSGTGDTEVAYWDIEEALHGGVGTLLKPAAPLPAADVAGAQLITASDSAYFVIDMQVSTTFDYFSVQWNRSMETGSRLRYFRLYGSNDDITYTPLEVVDKGTNWQFRKALNQAYTYRYIKVKVAYSSYNYSNSNANTRITYWHICNLNFGVLP